MGGGLADLQPELEQILSQLAEAYEVLSSPPKQLRYDQTLARDEERKPANDSENRDSVQRVQTPPDVIADRKYHAGVNYYKAADYHHAVENLREAVRLAPVEHHLSQTSRPGSDKEFQGGANKPRATSFTFSRWSPTTQNAISSSPPSMKKKACPREPRKCTSRCSRSIRTTR